MDDSVICSTFAAGSRSAGIAFGISQPLCLNYRIHIWCYLSLKMSRHKFYKMAKSNCFGRRRLVDRLLKT